MTRRIAHWGQTPAGFAKPASSPAIAHWGQTPAGFANPPTYTPPASSPATSPPPADPTPWLHDAGYNAAVGSANAQGGLTDSQSIYTRNTGLSDLGFTGDVNPSDPFDIQNLRVDPTNPYSKAALLQKHFDQSKAGDTNGLAARGQLYSGALQNALNNDQENYNQGFSGLTRQAAGLAQGASFAHQQTGINQNSTIGQALAAWLARQQPTS